MEEGDGVMTEQQAKLVGRNLARHRGEWVVLDNGKMVSHSQKLSDALKRVPKSVKNPAIYYSSADEAEMVCSTF